ncbi:MAG TPA: hypothetical protein VF771_20075 [Longimicrobiaceae bacterium]
MTAQLPFRWNLARRQQLGSLLDGPAAESFPGFTDELRECCVRVLALSRDSDLVFVGRSPESIFDYLSGVLADTSHAERCILLVLSMRYASAADVERTNPEGLASLREQLEHLGLGPAQIAAGQRPRTFVDLVLHGQTFGHVATLLSHWAAAEGVDEKAVHRRIGFIGITERTKNSPNTWRWYQQAEWAKEFPRSALRSVSIGGWLWGYLGGAQEKVSRWYPPEAWGAEEFARPRATPATCRRCGWRCSCTSWGATRASGSASPPRWPRSRRCARRGSGAWSTSCGVRAGGQGDPPLPRFQRCSERLETERPHAEGPEEPEELNPAVSSSGPSGSSA